MIVRTRRTGSLHTAWYFASRCFRCETPCSRSTADVHVGTSQIKVTLFHAWIYISVGCSAITQSQTACLILPIMSGESRPAQDPGPLPLASTSKRLCQSHVQQENKTLMKDEKGDILDSLMHHKAATCPANDIPLLWVTTICNIIKNLQLIQHMGMTVTP